VRIDLILRRWIDILAVLALAWRETWRSRRAFVVAREKTGFVVRQGGDRGAIVATAAAGSPAAAEFIRIARRRFVTFELPAADVAVQRINVPAGAREFLAGIVRNQIERLSPWQGDQVAYGFAAETNRRDAATLHVQVLMTSRAATTAVCEELAAIGLSIDRIVAREPGSSRGPPVTVWSRLDSMSENGRERVRRLIGLGLSAALALSAGLVAWALISASAMQAESEEAATRSAALQRQLPGDRGGPSNASRDPAALAWNLKATSPSSVMILETLSRTIPDIAYLTEFSLQGTTVRIVGMTSDAPSLIAPLEQSGQIADVHFFAPSTRAPDGASFVFHIEGRLTPRPPATEN
jgi:general secretion pathway protein L